MYITNLQKYPYINYENVLRSILIYAFIHIVKHTCISLALIDDLKVKVRVQAFPVILFIYFIFSICSIMICFNMQTFKILLYVSHNFQIPALFSYI